MVGLVISRIANVSPATAALTAILVIRKQESVCKWHTFCYASQSDVEIIVTFCIYLRAFQPGYDALTLPGGG